MSHPIASHPPMQQRSIPVFLRNAALALLAFIHSATGLAADPPIQQTVFGMPLVDGAAIEPSAFKDLFPVELIQIGPSMSITHARNNIVDKCRDKVHAEEGDLWTVTDQGMLFETFELQREDRGLGMASLEALYSHAPTEGRLRRLFQTFTALLGKPDQIYQQRNPSMIFDWHHDGSILRLLLVCDGYDLIEIELMYFPGPDNPVVPRLQDRLKPVAPGATHQQILDRFFEANKIFPPGDGPTPIPTISDSELGMLGQYSSFGFDPRDDQDRDWVLIDKPLKAQLRTALNKFYQDFSAEKKYQRLLAIAKGIGGGETQVGAAEYLVSSNDPAMVPYLFEGMKVSLPSGVSMACYKGVARFCTGDVMKKTITMLRSGEEDPATNAYMTLIKIETKFQLKELMQTVGSPRTDDEAELLFLIYAKIGRNIINSGDSL